MPYKYPSEEVVGKKVMNGSVSGGRKQVGCKEKEDTLWGYPLLSQINRQHYFLCAFFATGFTALAVLAGLIRCFAIES